MGYFTGRTGSIVYEGRPVAKIRDWSLDISVNMLSTDTIDSVVTTYTPGIKTASGSGTMLYYRLEGSDAATYSPFTVFLSKIMKQGAIETTDRITITLNLGPDPKDSITFAAYITQAQISTSTGELAVVPFQFSVDGDFINVIDP